MFIILHVYYNTCLLILQGILLTQEELRTIQEELNTRYRYKTINTVFHFLFIDIFDNVWVHDNTGKKQLTKRNNTKMGTHTDTHTIRNANIHE